jgi:hypothetical protein
LAQSYDIYFNHPNIYVPFYVQFDFRNILPLFPSNTCICWMAIWLSQTLVSDLSLAINDGEQDGDDGLLHIRFRVYLITLIIVLC